MVVWNHQELSFMYPDWLLLAGEVSGFELNSHQKKLVRSYLDPKNILKPGSHHSIQSGFHNVTEEGQHGDWYIQIPWRFHNTVPSQEVKQKCVVFLQSFPILPEGRIVFSSFYGLKH